MGVKVVHIVDPEYIFNSVFSKIFIKNQNSIIHWIREKEKDRVVY